MKQIKLTIILFLYLSVFVLHFAPIANAQTYEVMGKIDNNAMQSFGTNVIFKNATTKTVVSQTTADPQGNYSVAVPKGTYDIVIVPPAQSHIPQVTKTNQTINSNSEITVSLPNKPATPGNNYTGVILLLGIIAAIALVGFLAK